MRLFRLQKIIRHSKKLIIFLSLAILLLVKKINDDPMLYLQPSVFINKEYIALKSLRIIRARRIDRFLEGSPLSGQGMAFIVHAERNSHDPGLLVGLGFQESYLGRYARYNNPFGIMSSHGRLMRFNSWEESISYLSDMIAKNWGSSDVPEELKGYCKNDPKSWINGVKQGMRMENVP